MTTELYYKGDTGNKNNNSVEKRNRKQIWLQMQEK